MRWSNKTRSNTSEERREERRYRLVIFLLALMAATILAALINPQGVPLAVALSTLAPLAALALRGYLKQHR